MDLDSVAQKLDSFLYRKVFKNLTKADMESAKDWCFTLIRQNHPRWTEQEVQKYYDSLLNVKVIVVDQWTQKNS